MKVLIVEDEAKIAESVALGLNEYRFEVTHLLDGQELFEHLRQNRYDIYILDIMLPGINGLTLLEQLRKANDNTPVILLTARNQLDDRITGLQLGADDYLAKPFFVEELYERIQAILRRSQGEREQTLLVGRFKLDRFNRQAFYGANKVELTSREFNLLEYLMRSPGKIFTRVQILEHVWGYDFDPSTNIVDVCIKRIRAKMAEIDVESDLSAIESIRGIGYRFRDNEKK